jgi:uncharacterized membrane protein YphA (DoxX/SURF4 family)
VRGTGYATWWWTRALAEIAPEEAEVERLYSQFPVGSVGLALFLLRLADGFGLASAGIHVFTLTGTTPEPTSAVLLGLALVAAAILLFLGLRTAPAAIAACAGSATVAWYATRHVALPDNEIMAWESLLALVVLLSSVIALSGPGGYSLDARLSGWRRITLPCGPAPSAPPSVQRGIDPKEQPRIRSSGPSLWR